MSKDKVVDFRGSTRLPLDPDRVLEGAKEQLETVVIIGYTKEGELYFASSEPSGPEVLWLFELAKISLTGVMLE